MYDEALKAFKMLKVSIYRTFLQRMNKACKNELTFVEVIGSNRHSATKAKLKLLYCSSYN
ncbi:CLUMA_CG016741, isoform A [Clunio marinus]|uniref:CLUMA_CG016741, isoform A n=1 Tax=Clunio marinus TaxID=568069 RepID=A0A1J1IT09_9DIPT|nr:CLUMA_CG016741, isoform A [Clunio marinus]